MILLLRGGLALDGGTPRPADVLVEGERIAAVQAGLAAPAGAEVWELGGGLVIPGLINAH